MFSRHSAVRAVLFLVLVATGCAGGQGTNANGSGGSVSSDVGACWPVRALRLEALEHGSEWEPMTAIEADGQIVHLAKGRAAMGRLDHDRFLAGDKVVARCNDRFEIEFGGKSTSARFDADGAFVEKGMRIFVADDGEVHMTSNATVVFGPGGKGRARVQGPVREARRTAALLVLLSLAGPPH